MALKTVIDTNIFLHVINREEPYFNDSTALLDLVDDGRLFGVVSTISIAELSVGYYAAGDEAGLRRFQLHLLSSENYQLVDVDSSVAELAGKIRNETGLRLPDALIIASGLKAGVDSVVTCDEEFKKAEKTLKCVNPSEFLASFPSTTHD
jgi:predicted nucleic acid-binding protein